MKQENQKNNDKDFSSFFEGKQRPGDLMPGTGQDMDEGSLTSRSVVIRFIIRHSGGLIKNEKRAYIAVLVVCLVVIAVSAVLFIRNVTAEPNQQFYGSSFETGVAPEDIAQ